MGRYETPDYEVVKSDNNFQLRKYESFYIVEYYNIKDPEITNGFNTLFRYISRDNRENKKISMTVPVIEEVKSDKMKMAFVLPKEYWDKTPVPNSEYLNIRFIEEGLFAVVKYGGKSTPDIEAEKIELLKNWIEGNNLKTISDFMLAFYNPPFVPGILRRNEILVRVNNKIE